MQAYDFHIHGKPYSQEVWKKMSTMITLTVYTLMHILMHLAMNLI